MPQFHHPAASPALYSIEVDGVLDQEWSNRLGGMQIAVHRRGNERVTVISGDVADQAALLGVLNTLCAIGLPLRSVSQVPCAGTTEQ